MAKLKKKVQLTKKQKEILEDLITYSKAWGWQQDQGVGSEVDNAEKNFNEAKADMEKLLLSLNRQIKNLKDKKSNKLLYEAR